MLQNDDREDPSTFPYLVTLACAGGFLDVVKILLSQGADINLGQSTPLMEASQEGHMELVQYLIENGTSIFDLSTPRSQRVLLLNHKVPIFIRRLALTIQVR